MKFRIDGAEYDMIQANVTFAEARAVEKATGKSFASLATDEEAQQSASVIQAMLWVSMKRVNPILTFNDLDDIDMSSVEYVEEEADEEEAVPVPLDLEASPVAEMTSPSLV